MINTGLFYIGRVSTDKVKQFDHSYDWQHILETYKQHVSKDSRVLDIGSSSWIKAKTLASFCGEFVGLELFEDRTLSDFDNIRFVNGDWQHLTNRFPADSFDVIITSHVIEHVKDDLRALNEAYTVLKKRGALLVSTPNRNRLAEMILQLFRGRRTFPFWKHEREYIKKDLVRLIECSSFRNSRFHITGISFGLYGGLLWYLKKFPRFLEYLSGFWEVVIYK